MEEKEILKQLKEIKNIKPDAEWKRRNREILLKQINNPDAGQVSAESQASIWEFPLGILRRISEPAIAVVLIVLFMAGSGVVGLRAAKNTKPGDSLYIAKIVSEKTQFALTFNEKDKALLGIEFAGNRAKELSQVLAESNGEKEEQVEKLVSNFKKEVSAAKTRVEKMSLGNTAKTAQPADSGTSTASADGDPIFSANLGKDDNGIELSDPADDTEVITEPAPEQGATDTPSLALPETTTTTATSTDAVATSTAETEPAATDMGDPEAILKQAGESLDNDNFDTTITKLEEAVNAIDQVDNGDVKGESEAATSTESGASGAGATTTESAEIIGTTTVN